MIKERRLNWRLFSFYVKIFGEAEEGSYIYRVKRVRAQILIK
jgi:hypothetical protein